MIARAPAANAARNGTSSTRAAAPRASPSTTGSPRCESTSVAPWPGKCFTHAATPPAWRPVTNAATWRATSAGSLAERADADDGVERVRVDVGDRGEVVGDPRRRASSPPSAAATDSVSAESSTSPSASAPGTELPARRLEPGDVAALLVDRDDRRGRRRGSTRSAAQLLPVPRRCARTGRRRRARRRARGEPVRRRVAREAGQDAGAREPLERAAHPLTAPAVRPKAIRRWTSRKKTTTGIAVSVEAAISAPQSVLRLVP